MIHQKLEQYIQQDPKSKHQINDVHDENCKTVDMMYAKNKF